MADVLPSCIGIEGLLYLLFSGFVQANKSHEEKRFQLVRINPSGGERNLGDIIPGHKRDTFPISPH